MSTKLVFVVVFAIVAQGSFAESSSATVDPVLPESASEGINEILVNQEATVISKFNGFNPIFDMINTRLAAIIYNMTAITDGDSEKIEGALAQAKAAIDYSVNSFPIALRGSCECAETAKARSHEDLDDAYAVMSDAFTYAESSNVTEAGNKIEKVRNQAQADMADLVSTIYNCLRTCLNTTSDDVVAVTKVAQSGSGLGLVHVVNAVINAIKIYLAAYAAGSASAAQIVEVEECRVAALNGLRADVENKFSGLKALYINSYLNESGLAFRLDRNQYADTVSGYRFSTGIEIIFAVIETSLRNVIFGFSDAGTDDLTAEDIALESTIAKWNAATRQILISAQSNSEDTQKNLSDIVRTAATYYFNAIALAKNQSSNGSVDEAEITTPINNAIDQAQDYVEVIFDVFSNGKNLTDAVENELKILQVAAKNQMKIAAGSIHNATMMLAESTSETDLTTATESISSLKNQAIAAVRELANIIAYAWINVLRDTN